MRKAQIPKISYELHTVEGNQGDNRLAGAFALLFEEVLRVRQRKKDEQRAPLGDKVVKLN